ncbi:MAG: NfeD family protein [Candidatus Hodarchaeales archaeon]|jgi:membrane protein implicated in regulation of membrane protease activity
MISDLQEISLSAIILGVIILFLGSFLDLSELYNIGFIIFALGLLLVIIQWIAGGGVVELLNWLPVILIFTIITSLSSDMVSQSSTTQVLTWPSVGIILVVIVFFILFQGGDLSFLMQFLPVIVGLGLLGLVFGQLVWGDAFRGLAYSIGFLGITILLLWINVRKTQQKPPATGELSTIMGEIGVTTTNISHEYGGKVKIGTTIWTATSDSDIQEGETIRVIGTGEKNLVLEVQRVKS